MNQIKDLTILFLVLLVSSACTPNPGRKLIPEGEIQPEINVSTGSALGLGLRYGVSDFINAGIVVNSPPFSSPRTWDFLVTEPYVVCRLMKQKSTRPNLNLHYTIPITIYTNAHSTMIHHRFGLTVAYTFNEINCYCSIESYSQLRKVNIKDFPIIVRSGVEIESKSWFSHFYEAGLTAHSNNYLPLLSGGITFSIREYKKREKTN